MEGSAAPARALLLPSLNALQASSLIECMRSGSEGTRIDDGISPIERLAASCPGKAMHRAITRSITEEMEVSRRQAVGWETGYLLGLIENDTGNHFCVTEALLVGRS